MTQSEILDKIRQTSDKKAILERELAVLLAELQAGFVIASLAGKDPRQTEPERPPEIPDELMAPRPYRVPRHAWRYFISKVRAIGDSFIGSDIEPIKGVPKEYRSIALCGMAEAGWIKKVHGIWSKTPQFPIKTKVPESQKGGGM